MTELGLFLSKKSVNKAEISRRSGISKARLTQLSNSNTTRLTVEELYKIAMAMNVDPCDVLTTVCKGILLPDQSG
ncbi:helix-turn-helix transcriptional regulator [Mucilaginibacter sp. HC2]|uniref:helix-turn-helix domain-containing protein n=1 Tax=Mucilaginibacter TaxID=423349 RepID=UPI000CC4CB9F|nr:MULTISPECIES: helix-turn-helix transcriptional regulator [Mucilaginibacter]NHA05528.1 helix-turn-helix transcriptional regulator [Mucilaginibacter inviolabilis]QTE35336.1 helix-turn-helix transcriptional regulator [Mucilaginibacter gossypii]RAV59461.1 XRE family transcriptional regulator [Mucilaginibacter rubeus]HEK21116.1 XRE family transcriptional regulator [Bacteroidota bacterium]